MNHASDPILHLRRGAPHITELINDLQVLMMLVVDKWMPRTNDNQDGKRNVFFVKHHFDDNINYLRQFAPGIKLYLKCKKGT